MGIIPCPLPCNPKKESITDSNQSQIHSDSSNSLYSQPSLPSVPSLTRTEIFSNICASNSNSSAHSSSHVFCLSLAGKHLYAGNSNGQILLLNRNSSDNHASIVAQSGTSVKSIVILGAKLFSAHQDHKIRVWKINNDDTLSKNNYKCIATLPTVNDRWARLLCAKNYVEIRRHKKCTWVHHVDTVSALALSVDGLLLYSASWDRSFKVWRTADFKCLESVHNAHDDAINAIALSKDGYVYTGSADKKIKVWIKKIEGEKKQQQHTLVATLEKHKSAVNALSLSTDGSLLYSGACDRSIIVWEKDNTKIVVAGALRGHTKSILCLAVVSTDLLCSGSADKTVRIWKRGMSIGLQGSYSCLAVFEGHKGPVKCLTAGLDSNKEGSGSGNSYVVYSGGLDCDIKVWKFWVPYL